MTRKTTQRDERHVKWMRLGEAINRLKVVADPARVDPKNEELLRELWRVITDVAVEMPELTAQKISDITNVRGVSWHDIRDRIGSLETRRNGR